MTNSVNKFHRLVAEGNLKELHTALQHGADANSSGHAGMTALMLAMLAKDLEKAKLLIQFGADPELTDDFNATSLRHAVEADFADGVRFLISLGVDRGHHPRYPLKQVDFGVSLPEIAMPMELKGVLSAAEWQDSLDKVNQSMRDRGQNPTVEPMISAVQSVEVLRLFLDAGDHVNLAPREVQRALLGLDTGGELRVAPSDYRRHKSPRFGNRNPERMDNPFWKEMIRTGGNAYSARAHFQDNDRFATTGAVWCYDRFGASLTPLEDGRFVQVGGEHEDFYDPDFTIYNDVVIHDGRGDCQIFGYPCDVFPPTDFHTATLCRDGIYIVGSLGYADQRQPGFTPVYRLMLESWRIEPVSTTGEMPGWIHNHRAEFDPERNAIHIAGGEVHVVDEEGQTRLIPNAQRFELDVARRQWRRLH